MNWSKKEMRSIMTFNPKERIAKGEIAKKIPMGNLEVYTKRISGYEEAVYSSGPKFRNGDTLLARITPCLENGKTALVDILDEGEVAFGSTEFIVLRAKADTDKDYVYYLARSPFFRKRAISCMEGTSGRKRVNENSLKLQELPVPGKSEQIRISTLLSTLDAKIDLNNRINAELERLARTVYDYWFLQFDFPGADGRPYRSSGGEMKLDVETGWMIPKNWDIRSLADIANITMGQSPPGASLNLDKNGTVFYQGCTDFTDRFPVNRLFTTEPKRMAAAGDILLSVRAPVGTLNIANEDCCIGRGVAALSSKTGHDDFLFYVLSYLKIIFDRRNTDGTTFGSITKTDLHGLKVVVPPIQVLDNFRSLVNPGSEMINNNSYESRHLSALRDWLLPLLMSGEVVVEE
jgi:type I restriction enzyme S subunit